MDWNEIDINNIPDGVYYDMPIDIYHKNITHDSASTIKPAFESMAHYKANKQFKKEYKSHFDFGNAFELSLTDYESFNDEVAIFDPSDRPNKQANFGQKKNKEWKENFYIENRDKLIIPVSGADSFDVLTILKRNFYEHRTATTLLSNSNYQTSVFWTCRFTGLKLKTRPDFWKFSKERGVPIISDLKTDKGTTKDRHFKTIRDRNYPIQAVMQLDGLWQSGLIPSITSARYFWIFACKNLPYNTEVYEFDASDIELFLEVYRLKLQELKVAKDKNIFMSYDPNLDAGIKTVSFPSFYKNSLGIYNNIDS